MKPALPDGLIVVAKADCPTCRLVEPLLAEIAQAGPLTVYSQDSAEYAAELPSALYDQSLEHSFHLGIEFVPTLIRVESGQEVKRTYGWHKEDWRQLTGLPELGEALPIMRPGCGSKTLEPGISEELELAFGDVRLSAREIDMSASDDPMEACFERGWSDGLPVVPPTPVRVLRMLKGTSRQPDEVVGLMPPDLVPVTVEKVAINAVLAGCKPEYMPVLLAALEAALSDEFGLHGLICTTMFGSPMIVVNGPAARAIGMNSGVNALGQGNRANATIGRALQLIIRNVGGGRPGEIDRQTGSTRHRQGTGATPRGNPPVPRRSRHCLSPLQVLTHRVQVDRLVRLAEQVASESFRTIEEDGNHGIVVVFPPVAPEIVAPL